MAWQIAEWHIEALANAIVVPEASPDPVFVFDVMDTNLKEVSSVSYKQMKLIASSLVDQSDFMDAMEHQTAYWAMHTGQETDFTWATDTLSDWDDGTVTHMTERWMRHSLAAARVVQCQIRLYRKFGVRR
jgi:hypothetical protein